MKRISCKSHNLIYCITCKVCNKQYIGQTKNRIQDRFKGHFNNIRNNDLHPIGKHFNEKDHHGIRDVSISVLCWIYHPSNTEKASRERDYKELQYIHNFSTVLPFGLNSMN